MTKSKTKITYAFIVAALAVALSSSYITAPVMAQGAGLKIRSVSCVQNPDNSVTCSGTVSGAGTGATVTVVATGTLSSGCRTGQNNQGDPPGQQTNIQASGTAPITDSREGGSTPFSATTNAVTGPQPSCPSANMDPYFIVDFTSATVTINSPNKQPAIAENVPVN